MKIGKNRVRKLLLILVFVLLISFICGVLFVGILDDEAKKMIINSVSDYFKNINSKEINIFKFLLEEFMKDFLLYSFIWIMGISIVGGGVSLIAFGAKSFLVGFLFCSIIYTYSFKGVLLSIIYMIPQFISLFICLMICYYAISFSLLLYRYVFRKQEYNIKIIMARYLKLALISLGGVFINSLISVFLIPNLLKLFNF